MGVNFQVAPKFIRKRKVGERTTIISFDDTNTNHNYIARTLAGTFCIYLRLLFRLFFSIIIFTLSLGVGL